MSRVYRNISRPLIVFGLELMDLLALAVCFIVVFNLSDHLVLNALALAAVYGGLRHFKRGRAAGYLAHLIRFLLSPSARGVSLNDDVIPYPTRRKGSKRAQ